MTSPPSSTPITDPIRNLGINDTDVQLPQSEELPCLTDFVIRPQSLLMNLPAEVAKLPVDMFMKHLLPSIKISEKEMDQVHAVIEKELYSTASSQWKDMQATGTEGVIFNDFGKVANGIIKCATTALGLSRGRAPKSLVSFRSDGAKTPDFVGRNPSGHCYLHSSDRAPKHEFQTGENIDSWDRICVAHAYECYDSLDAKMQNVRKVLGSMHHIMGSDPCRRLTYGLTIEGSMTRLWFFCHSFLMVSERFDFQKDWRTLVAVILSFGYASEEELGWDLTIRYDNSLKRHILAFEGKDFIVCEVLANLRFRASIGRATWVVLAKHGTEEPVVFKDFWSEIGRELDDKIQADILNDLKAYFKNDDAEYRKFSSMFFTILGVQKITLRNGDPDDTEALTTRNGNQLDLSLATAFTENSERLKRQRWYLSHDEYFWKTIYHRVHVRMKIQERATPIMDVYSLRDSFALFRSATEFIHVLSRIGWVHRDLSPANVYYWSGNLKIGDFEFAKKFAVEETKAYVRVGTRQFWSVEIEAGKFLHLPRTDSLEGYLRWKNSPNRWLLRFQHLPLHDFESIWWIISWILLMRVPKNPSVTWSEKVHGLLLDEVFPTTLGTHSRIAFLTGERGLTLDVLENVDRQILPLFDYMQKFRECLVSAFMQYEEALNTLDRSDLDTSVILRAFRDYEPLLGDRDKPGVAFVDALKDGLLDALEVDQEYANLLDVEMVDVPA